jgi:hypothetical protein
MVRLVDYAGLFPPAALSMADAVERYGRYRFGEDDWALGRFVIPVGRLEEFEQATAKYDLVHWRLSALIGEDAESDFARVRAFNEQHACIDTIEVKAASAADVTRLAALVPADVRAWFEVEPGESLAEMLSALNAAGHGAKLRMGGTTQDMFPSSDTVARFLLACAHAGVRFKATAGLHHPLRSPHRLTYADDSAMVLMHGFVNLFLAAAVALEAVELAVQETAARSTLVALLEERDVLAFTWKPEHVVWRRYQLDAPFLARVRESFARSFGSCSFEEPLADLRTLRWL